MDQNVNPTPQKKTKKIHFEILAETGTLSYDGTKKYFSTVGAAIFAFSMLTFLGQAVLAMIVFSFPQIMENSFAYSLASYAISFIPLYCFGLPVMLSIFKKLPEVRPFKQKMKGSHVFLGMCMCICFMYAGSYVSNLLMTVLQKLKGAEIANPVETATAGSAWWLNLLFVGILAPILEEILFRKLVCRYLLPLGEGWAVVLSAAIFGLAHGNFYQFFYAFALGLFFGFIYVKTGKLIYSIFYHMVINILGGVIAPVLMEMINSVDLEMIESIASDPAAMEALMANPAELLPTVIVLLSVMTYNMIMYGAAITGLVLFFVSLRKNRFKLDSGLLPPVKKGRYSALFLNAGIALSIAYFAFTFILSLV